MKIYIRKEGRKELWSMFVYCYFCMQCTLQKILTFKMYTQQLYNGLVINNGQGRLQNRKIAGPKLCARPPQDRVKLFTHPLLKSGNVLHPPSIWLKRQATHKNYSKSFCSPPSAWLKLVLPPFLTYYSYQSKVNIDLSADFFLCISGFDRPTELAPKPAYPAF